MPISEWFKPKVEWVYLQRRHKTNYFMSDSIKQCNIRQLSKLILPLSGKGSTVKGENLLPLGANSFL